jgi:hypothetical protein
MKKQLDANESAADPFADAPKLGREDDAPSFDDELGEELRANGHDADPPIDEGLAEDDPVEIRVEAHDKINAWRDRLDQTAKMKKRDVFERAADDLFLEAGLERDLAAVQAIGDAVYELGRDHAGLGDDDIQFVMVGAKSRAKGDHKPVNDSEPPPAESPRRVWIRRRSNRRERRRRSATFR